MDTKPKAKCSYTSGVFVAGHTCYFTGTMEPPSTRLEGFSLSLGVTEAVGFLMIILVTVWTGHFRGGFAWTSEPAKEFNWHPLLMTIGMIFIYANSILIYRAFRNTRKRKLKLAHLILHLIAFLLIVIGLVAVFDSHNLATPPIPNMYSLHSWIGLSSVIMFSCQWISGFITFFFPGLQVPIRSAYMPVHVFFGVAGFIAAVASALLGITEKAFFSIGPTYSSFPSEGVLINFIGITMVMFGGLVTFLVTEPRFKRQALPEDEMLLTSGLE